MKRALAPIINSRTNRGHCSFNNSLLFSNFIRPLQLLYDCSRIEVFADTRNVAVHWSHPKVREFGNWRIRKWFIKAVQESRGRKSSK